jgi:adenine-specific DNA methylase
MDVSLKSFKNEHQHKFDVLNKQLGDDYHGYRIPIRFEDIRKPTELEPFKPPVSKEEAARIKLMEEAPKVQAEINSLITAEEKIENTFTPPESFSAYIKKLLATGQKKFRILPFDMEDAHSEGDVRVILKKELEQGVINEEQKKEMESFLADTKQQRLEKLKNDHGIIIG